MLNHAEALKPREASIKAATLLATGPFVRDATCSIATFHPCATRPNPSPTATAAQTFALVSATCPAFHSSLPALQNPDGQVVGATVRDTLSGKQHTVYARTIINAAGPFSDEVRALSQVIRRCIVLLSAVLCCAAHGMSWHWCVGASRMKCRVDARAVAGQSTCCSVLLRCARRELALVRRGLFAQSADGMGWESQASTVWMLPVGVRHLNLCCCAPLTAAQQHQNDHAQLRGARHPARLLLT